MSNIELCFIGAAISFAAAFCAVPLLMRLARKLNIVDQPLHRKIHKQAVPYLGGAALLAGLVAGVAFSLTQIHNVAPEQMRKAAFILVPSALAFLLGLADDKFKLAARAKLIFQAVVALAFALFAYHFDGLTLPGLGSFSLHYLGEPITVFWILSVVNAVNIIDGADGLALSVCATVLIIICLMAAVVTDLVVAAIALSALAACVAVLIFNWRPAKIYIGDAGSMGLGMTLAGCLLALGEGLRNTTMYNHMLPGALEPFAYKLPLVTGVLAYPLLEMCLTVFRRALQGKSIASADKGHIHHRLLNRGWKPEHVAYFAIIFSLTAGGAVVCTMVQVRGVAVWYLAASGLLLGFVLHFGGVLDALSPLGILWSRPHFLVANHFIAMQKIKLQFVENVTELTALLTQTCVELGVQSFTMVFEPRHGEPEAAKLHWMRPDDAQGSLLPAVQPSVLAGPTGNPRREQPLVLDTDAPNAARPARATQPSADAAVSSDRVELSNPAAKAEWFFEPASAEEDLDVEYRVLMSEFMRMALVKAAALRETLTPEQFKSALNADVALHSNHLRRRSSLRRDSSA
ncbi:MAG TPA: MraY family glycosyltransferase [Planctomycetota bacterium]|jgi:UDP-GlcNAc:undecaprenyl-phosphate GlcNAc-1-phosphate transferase